MPELLDPPAEEEVSEFGGVPVNEPAKSEFGGIPVEESSRSEFGGVPVEEPAPERAFERLPPAPMPESVSPSDEFYAGGSTARGSLGRPSIPTAEALQPRIATEPLTGSDVPIINPAVIRRAIDIGTATTPIPRSVAPLVEGLKQSATEQLAGLTTPESIAQAPAFAIPVVGPALAIGLGAKSVGTGLGTTVGALEAGNMEEAGHGLGEVAGGGTMLLGGAHGATGLIRPKAPIPPVIRDAITEHAQALPKAAAALLKDTGQQLEKPIEPEPILPSEQTKPQEVSSARNVEKTATVHGDLRPPTGESQGEVPVAQGERGILPREEPAGNVPRGEQKAPALRDLKTTEQAWDYGAERQSPEGIAELEKAKTEFQARLDAIKADPNLPPMEKLNQRAAMATEGQLIQEALSAAKKETDRPAMTDYFERKAAAAAPPAGLPSSEVAPEPVVKESLTPAAQKKATRDTFTERLKEYGEQLGFILRPDDVHGYTGGSTKTGQSGASVKAKMRHDQEMAASRRRAITELGGDPAKPDFAALNAELEKRIADYEEQQTGGGVHTVLTGKESTEFLPPEPTAPKLGTGEKGTGDLFKGEDQPFNLAGEKGVDTERIAAEKAAAEQRAAEAKAAQEKQQPGLSLDVENVARQPKGIAAGVRRKWATATDQPLGSEAGFITLGPIEDFLTSVTKGIKGVGTGVKNAFDATRAAYKENMELQKTSDYRRSILHWSAKMQRSFSEAAQAQNELRQVIKEPVRRDAATNWIQAGGDANVLRQRLAATQAWRDPVTGKPHPEAKRLTAGYEAALNLTPEEMAAATDAKDAYDALGQRGQTYDVLKTFKPNYVTQVWDIKKGPTGGNKGFGFGARTLKERFRFAKASTFPTFFDGEQAGFVPKTKDISNLLPMYLHEMNNVIAARQLVEQLARGTASDGKPLLLPRGAGVAVDNAAGKATLIMPDAMKADTEGYVRMDNQPALHDWTWQTKDAAGNPVFMKSDLVIHPEAADKFRNVLSKSAISQWYESKTSAGAEIPKGIAKFIDRAQSETKRTMLGLLSPFHQVQEGTHAVGHRVNPFFNNPKIDLVNDAAQMEAAQHGLMLQPDRISAQQFMEGFKQSGLVSKIPGIGALADHYANYLFHEYIPGIKFKTYEAIRDRNLKVFEKDLASGKVSPEDVKILSAEQANAAYGHLNYADLGHNPTMLHFFRLGLLAPDFLEARARFAGQALKGVTGGKVGREQLIALATLAVAQATLAYVSSKITGGEWDAKDPFAFHLGKRKYTMRSVPEDLVRFVTDTRAFTYARLNPLVGRGIFQYGTGVDWRGKRVTAGETTKELLQQPVPLTLRPLLGIGNTPLSGWEELAGAAGLKISRYSNVGEMSKLAHKWMDESTNPRIKAAEKSRQQETLADSAYKPLRDALQKDDTKEAQKELQKLLTIRKFSEIKTAMHAQRPFTGALKVERQFKRSLNADEKLQYDAARKEQGELYKKFRNLKHPKGESITDPTEFPISE